MLPDSIKRQKHTTTAITTKAKHTRLPRLSPARTPVVAMLSFAVAKTLDKITIEKEKLRPRQRAPILPSKKFEDKKAKTERRAKHKKDPRREPEAD